MQDAGPVAQGELGPSRFSCVPETRGAEGTSLSVKLVSKAQALGCQHQRNPAVAMLAACWLGRQGTGGGSGKQ